MINAVQLRRPGSFVGDDIAEEALETLSAQITKEIEVAGPIEAYRTADGLPPILKKFYFAMCMAQTSRGGGMTEIFIDEHPLVWIERKRGEMKVAGIIGVMVIQFFSEIPYDVYREMKELEQKQIITPPEKKIIIGK